MNRKLIGIAIRNIMRNRRRTALNMIALTVGMAIIIASLGWMRGYFTTLYDGKINLDTGHVQILHERYRAEERRLPLDLVVPRYREIRDRIEKEPGVVAASGRIHFELELGNGREYTPMRGRAVDIDHEREITTLQNFIVAGSYFRDPAGSTDDRGSGVLLGETAATLLDVGVGDTVFIRVRDRYGAPNTISSYIVGLFRTGYPLFDRYLVVTDLDETSAFLRMGEGVTHLVLRGHETLVPASLPDDLVAYPWREFARTMIAAVEADIGAFGVLLAILFLLILLGILNSMSMTVRERKREIGTMRAIGLKRGQLRNLLITESIVVAVLAVPVAAVVGGVFAGYVQFVGIDITQYMPADLPIPFGDRFYGDYRPVDFLVAALFGVVAAIAGSLIPARRAVKTSIVEAMQHGGR